MKVLRIYPKLPPLKGGMEQHLKRLSQEQIKAGHEVRIIFNSGEKVSEDDVKLLSFLPLTHIKPQFLGHGIFYIATIIFLLLRKVKADVVHIHGDWNSFIFGGLIKRICSSEKLFFSIHGGVADYRGIKKGLLIRSLRKAEAVFCTGHEASQFLKPFARTIFQPSGIHPIFFKDHFVDKNLDFSVITVANMVRAKNLNTLIKIAAQLPGINFILVGDGPLRKTVQQSAAEHRLNNISFKGFLSPQEIAIELQKSHVFLLTSLKEGTPTAILEAMASGLAIVSSNAGGIGQFLISNENGFIIDDAENVSAYSEKIEWLSLHKSELHRLEENNRKKADHYIWDNVAKNISKVMLNE